MTTRNIKAQYISLLEAAKISSYSQEYLSLRARQGKLRAEKIGRNWVTTKEWLAAYTETAETFKNNGYHHELVERVKYVAPPANLPIEGFREKIPLSLPLAQVFKLTGALALVLLFTVGIHDLDLPTKTENVILQTPNYVKNFSEGFDRGVREFALDTHFSVQALGKGFDTGLPTVIASLPIAMKQVNANVQNFSAGFSYGLASPASVESLIGDYGQWIGEQVTSLHQTYKALDEKLSTGIARDVDAISQGYENVNQKVTQGIQNNVTSLTRLSSEKLRQSKDIVGNAFSNAVGGIKARIARVSEEARPQPEP